MGTARVSLWSKALLLASLALPAVACAAQPAMADAATPMPRVSGPIPETAKSVIFSPAVLPGTTDAEEMRAAGYVQEEYFVSGIANVYTLDPAGKATPTGARLPYTTHIVVLRPRDPAKFSGIVQLTNGHPLYGNLQWGRISRYVLWHGDAYVGLMNGGDQGSRAMSKPEAPVSSPLVPRWFDPQRYASIRWGDEDGIRWDVFSDVARALRSADPHGPLGGLPVKRIYASGWSYLGSFLRSFIQYGFHDRLRDAAGHPLIDGYLIGISSGSVQAGHVPISTAADHAPYPAPDAILPAIDVPVIELQSENEAITDLTPQTPEIDSIAGGHRLWTLGGVTHTDIGRPDVAAGRDQALAKLGTRQADPPCDLAPTDVAMADVAGAALFDLDRWVGTGATPPSAAPVPPDPATHLAKKDGVGNALGGVRVPQLEVPLARYGAPGPGARCTLPAGFHFLPMKRTPLDPATLARLYPGGAAAYLARFDAVTAALVAQGWLLPPDAAREQAAARRFAATAFAH